MASSNAPITDADLINAKRVFWHSRRGMLELDLLLVPFSTAVFTKLPALDQLLYVEFLEQEDQDLFKWLMGREEPADTRFIVLIAQILAHSRKSV